MTESFRPAAVGPNAGSDAFDRPVDGDGLEAEPGESLEERVAAAFDARGALARALNGFQARAGQQAMARAVARSIDEGRVLLAEAGTGVGKSYGYLVPVLASGRRALISTATKTLQDQLFHKDLPTVRDALGLSADIALLKGRSNYLCLLRLEQAAADARLPTRAAAAALRRVQWLARISISGDRAELPDVAEDDPIWPYVTSTADNCLGTDCRHWNDCFVVRARRRALEAECVVINHHLFFADLLLRDTGFGEILPNADLIVFDEAHQLAEIGVMFAGINLSSLQWVDLARDTLSAGLRKARSQYDWTALHAATLQAARELRLQFGDAANRRLPWAAGEAGSSVVEASLHRLLTMLEPYEAALDSLAEADEEWRKLRQRAQHLRQLVEALIGSDTDSFPVRYVEIGQHVVRWRAGPLDIAESFGPWLESRSAATVLTSATLADPLPAAGDSDRFGGIRAALGIAPQVRAGQWPSPFDFASQGRLYVASDLPPPSDPAFERLLVARLTQLVRASRGGSLVLCTSLRATRSLGAALGERLGAEMPVMIQGSLPKNDALRRMRRERALLIGSHSFWEGVDLPGLAVTLVAIDKLPFAPPDDPVLQARLAAVERRGGSGFNEVSLPHAALLLKQGAGRLIRTADDHGVLAIFDSRLAHKGYGRLLRKALPELTQVDRLEEACSFLAAWAPTTAAPAPAACDDRG